MNQKSRWWIICINISVIVIVVPSLSLLLFLFFWAVWLINIGWGWSNLMCDQDNLYTKEHHGSHSNSDLRWHSFVQSHHSLTSDHIVMTEMMTNQSPIISNYINTDFMGIVLSLVPGKCQSIDISAVGSQKWHTNILILNVNLMIQPLKQFMHPIHLQHIETNNIMGDLVVIIPQIILPKFCNTTYW